MQVKEYLWFKSQYRDLPCQKDQFFFVSAFLGVEVAVIQYVAAFSILHHFLEVREAILAHLSQFFLADTFSHVDAAILDVKHHDSDALLLIGITLHNSHFFADILHLVGAFHSRRL